MPRHRIRRTGKRSPIHSDVHGGIDYGLAGMGELLRAFRLYVPKYQRDYAWDEQNVIDLLDDIAGAIEKGEARHFLGSIVMTRLSAEELEIVDGQQRLATAFMILCAIRDYFDTHHDAARAKAIVDKYLATADLKTKTVLPRITLNATDDPFFQDHVIDRSPSSGEKIRASKASHQRIGDRRGPHTVRPHPAAGGSLLPPAR